MKQEIRKLCFYYEYTRKYGEPLPLNLNVSREYLMILNLGKLDKSKLANELDPEIALAFDLHVNDS
jgi:hypothetical protein